MALGSRCWVRIGKTWKVISIDEALAGIGADYRCLGHKHESVSP
jgi:hypothetical protein